MSGDLGGRSRIAYIAAGHYFGGPRRVLSGPCCFCGCGGTVTPAAGQLGLHTNCVRPVAGTSLEGWPIGHGIETHPLSRLGVACPACYAEPRFCEAHRPSHTMWARRKHRPAVERFRRAGLRHSCGNSGRISSARRCIISGSHLRTPWITVVWSRSSAAPMSA